MRCYGCANDATRECRRCGRLYCDEHGDELCAECLKPAGALPSFLLYRGSLLALLLGTVVALWLLLKPPHENNNTAFNVVEPTATATIVRTPTAQATAATPTVVVSPAPTSGNVDYTVQEGDSLFGIAAQFQPSGENLADFANRIALANGLDPANPMLSVGQVLHIPQ